MRKRSAAALLMVAVVALTGCSSVWSDPVPTGSSPEPSASTYEIVPGADFSRATGKTTFTSTPTLASIAITTVSDPSVTKTFLRRASTETARLLDELASALAAPDEAAVQGVACTTEGIVLPSFRVTVIGHGEALDPVVPIDRCGKPQLAVRMLLEEFASLPADGMTTIN